MSRKQIPVRCPVCRGISCIEKDLGTISDPIEIADLPCSQTCFEGFQRDLDHLIDFFLAAIHILRASLTKPLDPEKKNFINAVVNEGRSFLEGP